MGRFARIRVGQPAEASRKALAAIQLTDGHASFRLVEGIKEVVPFRHILISGLDVDGYSVGTGTYLLTDFPEDYLPEYYAGDYIDTDPLVSLFSRGQTISSDSQAFATAEARKTGRSVLNLLRRHAIVERTVIRVSYGGKVCGTISVISDQPLTEPQCELLQHFAMSLHAEISRPVLRALNGKLKLTKGELYCLGLAARGLTSEDIARENIYSVETVNTYLKSATRKLGAQNRTQAVAEAIRRQLIG